MIYDRVLILGGGGMLAHALKAELASVAGKVVAPARAEVDVCDAACLERTFDEVLPTLVLNCAAHTKVDLCDFQRDLALAINGRAAGEAARLAHVRGAAFVHYSTDFVFPGDSPRAWREEDAVGPLSEYGRSKLEGETQVLAGHPAALVLRTSWLYGPGGPNFPTTMVRAAKAGKPLSVVADQFGSPTFTHDLARTTVELLDAGATGVFHVSNSGETTWRDFAAATLEEFGMPAEVKALTSADWKRMRPESTDRPLRSTMDCSKAEGILGRPMRPWREALREFRSMQAV